MRPAFDPALLARWSGGTWFPSRPDAIQGVSIDTRSLSPGCLFVAIKGPNHDGHTFLAQAFEAGAAAAVAARSGAPYPVSGPLLLVEDTLSALRRIASGHRWRVNPEIIAVTGSVGKTTVKEMIAQVLGAGAPTARTMGNWNNEIGLPLSLLAMSPCARIGVFEVGMNHPGELAPLCALLSPNWALVTRIGPVHLEFFKSVEAIAEEKAEVLRALGTSGVAVLCRDDPYFETLRRAVKCRMITLSIEDSKADYTARLEGDLAVIRDGAGGLRLRFRPPLPGAHNLLNSLFAVAIGLEHGLTAGSVRKAIEGYRTQPMRWETCSVHGAIVVNDAYNANPLSMRAALRTFGQMPCVGAKWLVLAGMRELGPAERPEHESLGREVAAGPWAGLVTVGSLGRVIAEAALEAGMAERLVRQCADAETAAGTLAELVRPGDAVLFKASRGERLERVLEIWRDR